MSDQVLMRAPNGIAGDRAISGRAMPSGTPYVLDSQNQIIAFESDASVLEALGFKFVNPGGISTDSSANIPIATTSIAGKVKPDGTTVTIDVDGTIHAPGGGGLVEPVTLTQILTLDAGMQMLNGDPGTAPGAGKVRWAVVPGTDSGTAKLLLYAGTSTTPLVVADNIGGGF
jgi:hypothetical protein